MVYAPGTAETDPKKQNRSLQANAAATATNTTNIAANTAALAALAPIASSGSASDLSTGTVPTARLGSGSATASTFLAGDQSYKAAVTSVVAGTGLSGGTITGTGTVALALTNAMLQTNLANPTGTTSGTGLMMGLGGVAKLTPVYSTRILAEFRGNTTNSVSGGQVIATFRFGTSTAPANAAALTGTVVGNPSTTLEPGANGAIPFNVGVIITGLTPGTAYWFDLSVAATAGTGAVQNLSFYAMEF